MEKLYLRILHRWCWAVLLVLGMASGAQAQSGPYGNEWINPNQTYYKLQVTRDGIYRLDFNYLTRAGITGVSPQRIQLWRRGQQVARYIGGNRSQLDATTYLEFFGQRNDGQLDQQMYKAAAHQPNRIYSLFTDTAAYFLTVSATANGRDMVEPTATATTPHATWQQQRLRLFTGGYQFGQTDNQLAFLPWADTGEGFASGYVGRLNPTVPGTDPNEEYEIPLDSVLAVASGGATPQLEVVVVGSSPSAHSTTVSVTADGSPQGRTLGALVYNAYDVKRMTFSLLRSDIGGNGVIKVKFAVTDAVNTPRDRFRIVYFRVTYPHAAQWPSAARSLPLLSDSTLAGPAYYVLDNLPATVRGYDVTDPLNVQRVAGTSLSGTQRGYAFPGANGRTRRLLLFDAAQGLVPGPAQAMRFRAINPASHNFLIITSRILMQPVNGVNQVREYARYRATGGPGHLGYDTLVVTSEQLYDQFHYGERSPLAVRHFVKYMLTAPRTDRYLLMLGKGVLISEEVQDAGTPKYWYRQAPAALRNMYPDLVPGSTRGGSDIFFSADWETGDYVPRIPTGRIAATTAGQVKNYLDKLKDHEALGPEPWRKNILHMAGGQTQSEFVQFQSWLRDFQRKAEGPFFGARVQNLYNTTTGGSPVVVNLAPQVNDGLSLITYFGHGSTRYLNIMPTDITVPSNGYNNYRKYPVIYINGCAAGNNYTAGANSGSIGEDWLLIANKGAIGFLADSDFGIDGELYQYCREIYTTLFNDPNWYGKPVAVIQAEVNRRLMAPPIQLHLNSPYYGVSMLMNTTWQGDPALVMFAPEEPDYQFTANTTGARIEPIGAGPVLATSTRFNVRLQVSNPGKIVGDSLRVTVTRRVGNGTPLLPVARTFHYFLRDTTLVLEMTNPAGVSVIGLNTFVVKLDDPNVIGELNENNNTATFTYNFLNGGVTPLNPTNFAIVKKAGVRLVGQSNLPQAQPLDYEFQLDTVATFRTPLRIGTVRALDVAGWTPGLPAPVAGRDSVVYYWRFRFRNAPAGLDTTWAVSSFRFINNSPEGWSQSHYGQMASNQQQNISQTAPGGRWEFAETALPIQLTTRGARSDTATFQLSYGINVNGRAVRVDNCGQYGVSAPDAVDPANIMVAVFEPRRLRQLNNIPGGTYNRCGEVGSVTYFYFATKANDRDSLRLDNINTDFRQRQLLGFLQNVPNGAYVALVSMNRVNFPAFRADLKAQFTAMGSSLINTVQNGDPLLMVLRKGFPTQTQEATFSATDPLPRTQQVVTLNATLRTRVGSGTVTSTRIGPAQQWQTLYHTIKKPDGAADSYTLRLIGYNAANVPTVLNPSVTSLAQSLAAIDARTYPYLQLEAELRDTTNLTPPQLKQWLVTYQGVPEGVVRRDHPGIPTDAYAATTLSAAASSTGILNVPVYFENVSSIDFAALARAKAYVTETSSGRVDTVSIRATRLTGFSRRPSGDSTAVYNFRLNVTAVRGDATIRITANSQNLPELVAYNNDLNLSFTAPSITVPPVLDVAFDGTHILNGDIVSTRPEIVVDVKYEDKRRPLTDPSKVEVYLTRPAQGNQAPITEQIDMANTSLIRFENDAAAGRSRVYYTPGAQGALPDGVYTLQVQAKDMAGFQAAAQRYSVTFEVINQASITNVFPYPNPVTSKARFVFTLTGSTPPRNMKIQILTLSGKVVKEITQAELGNVHVGNNLTDYAWDGTDSYGDRLANGTYLYRVLLDDAGSEYEHRRTAADQAFKKGWGKLVLLR